MSLKAFLITNGTKVAHRLLSASRQPTAPSAVSMTSQRCLLSSDPLPSLPFHTKLGFQIILGRNLLKWKIHVQYYKQQNFIPGSSPIKQTLKMNKNIENSLRGSSPPLLHIALRTFSYS